MTLLHSASPTTPTHAAHKHVGTPSKTLEQKKTKYKKTFLFKASASGCGVLKGSETILDGFFREDYISQFFIQGAPLTMKPSLLQLHLAGPRSGWLLSELLMKNPNFKHIKVE